MSRFFRVGKSKAYYVSAVANLATPTTAEVNAGVNITADIADIGGFEYSNDQIETPDLASDFTSKIPGRDQVGDCSLTFYDSDTGTHAARTAMPKGQSGYIVFAPYASPAGKRCEVWPIQVTSVGDEWTTDAKAAQFQIGISVTGKPNQTATFPTGVTI